MIVFTEANGTIPYAIGDVPGEHQTTLPYIGSLTVNGGPLTEPTLVFTPMTYAVTFTESGLPGGTTWYLNITSGRSNQTTGTTVGFFEQNGSYDYAVATTDKEYPSVGGSFTVQSAAVRVSVAFVLVTYTVTFTETGLPSGTNWSIVLEGTAQASTSSTITFTEPNSTYSFTVGAWTGGTAYPAAGRSW